MPDRRSLKFASLNEVMPDVDRLLTFGYQTVGNWSLGQICNHVGGGIRLSMEGFGGQAPWLIRATVGRFARGWILTRGQMPAQLKLPQEFAPAPDVDDRAEAEALRAAIDLFNHQAGPMAIHPFLGLRTRADWQRFHTVHAAHHLSFVLPALRAKPVEA